MQSLAGKKAVITGAGKGLGKAIAYALAEEGVHLGLVSRTQRDLESLSTSIATLNKGNQVRFEVADISRYQDVKRAMSSLSSQLGGFDMLINNAGIVEAGRLQDVSVTDWERVIQTNLLGAYYMIHEVLPQMLFRQSGDIVNIASTAGQKGSAGLSAYSASKAGLISLSESLMYEVRNSNIRVFTVNPSTVATEMILTKQFSDGNPDKVLQPSDLAQLVVSHLKLPNRAFVKEVGLWSTNP